VTKDKTSASIVIDAMGGDFAPAEVVKGSIEAYNEFGSDITLVGDPRKILSLAVDNNLDLSPFTIEESKTVVEMGESPSKVLKEKKDSSLYIGPKLVAEGKGAAFLSAGNTGATMACSLFNIKRIRGVSRPAIAVVIPLADSNFVLIDGGANADCKPQNLAQFAIMGKVFSRDILGIEDPGVALLNIGEEEKKGSELAVQSNIMLKQLKSINFMGNIEGREVFQGKADVVVTDGFTGNVILKAIEGLASMFFGEIKDVLTSSAISKLAALSLRKPLRAMKNKFDYETYGGAQLLGLNAPVIISHGSSKARAIKNAIRVAGESLEIDLVEKIRNELGDSF
jgi:glycerol-3-phosphate acyltransferase PlsX